MGRGARIDAGAGAGGAGRVRGLGRLALGCVAAGALGTALPSAAVATPAKVTAKLRAAGAPLSELVRTEAIPLPGGARVYRFQQEVSGFEVLNSEAVLADALGAPPKLLADATKPRIESPPTPQIARSEAIGGASESAGAKRLRGHPSASLAIQPGDGGTLVWRVLIPSARPLGDFEVLVDARSGDVLRVQNLLRDFRSGRAKLYNPNPVVENGGFDRLRSDNDDRDTRLLTRLRRRVVLRKIWGGQHCLRGKWAHVKLGRNAREVCRKSLRWRRVTRSDNRFEALMVYYHITRAQKYIQQLGFSDSNAPRNGINDHNQVAIADAFAADNDYYSPFDQRIRYGTGGVDDAEDADVILHEYAHAMQDRQSHSFVTSGAFQDGALAEGSADYWAAVMSSLSSGTTNPDDVCIFDWDGTTWGPVVPTFHRRCGRRADDERTLSQAKAGPNCSLDIHCVGQVWSSALWDLRKVIGAATTDRIYLTAQFMYHARETFDQAATALVNADKLLNAGVNKAAICAEMKDGRELSPGGCP